MGTMQRHVICVTLGFYLSTKLSGTHVNQHIDLCFECRNMISWAITGAILGLNVGDKNAWAAARWPPPPPEERKDPNVSGVQAKVLASKKRKEAMKQAMAEQRARGKPIQPQ